MLYVCGADITNLTLGILGRSGAKFSFKTGPVEIPSAPENYLGIINSFLEAHGAPLEQLTGIVVVSSAGSATALRSAHAIANALAFARGLPVYAARQEDGVTHELMIDHIPAHPSLIALPAYVTAPQVITSTRDALKRRT